VFSRSFLFPELILVLVTCALSTNFHVHALEKTENADFPDPALSLTAAQLSADEIKTCRQLFQQLAGEDFDLREQALNHLIAKGPAVLPLALEFAKDSNAEIATQARGLRQRMLQSFDGYLPTSPALTAAMNKRIDWQYTGHDLLKFLKENAEKAGLQVAIDPNLAPTTDNFEGVLKGREGTLKEFFLTYGQWLNLGAIPRGDVLFLTKPETAQRLAAQRYTFSWSDLSLSRDEAERVGKALTIFFPPVTTEIHTGSEVFSIRADETAIARAARLIALLKPGSPDAIFPRETALAENPGALAENLSKPVWVALSAEDPLNALFQLKRQKVDVFVASANDPLGSAKQEGPFDRDVDGASPLRLSLHDLPLGLVLRWIERRTKFPAAEQADSILGFETGPGGRLQFRLQPRGRAVQNGCVLGADVSFLYPRGAKPGEESDTAARADLLAAIDPHLMLFPVVQSRDIVVLRGRLFMQGSYATLARTLDLVRQWRAANAPPAPPLWKATLDARLSSSIHWVAEGMTGGRLLPSLRSLGKVNILLEDAPDGTAPSFQLTAEEAHLLPTGDHTLRALLDDLAKKAGAQWRAELGVIVITPKVDEPKK